jgi:16S rRNA (guanine527-N7)-methyltransferase
VTSREFREKLVRRAKRAGAPIGPDLAARLETYYRLLVVWNEKINLTGLRVGEFSPDAIDRLLIEPIVAARHLPPGVARMLDAGSGGGSPAIPLALSTGVRLVMVEAKTRKSVFLREAVRALEMTDATVLTARFEELLSRPELHEAHELLTIRAVRLEPRTFMTLQAFVKPGGHLFLFRGSAAGDPHGTLTPPLSWVATYPLLESAQSRLVVLTKRPIGRGGGNWKTKPERI